MKLDRTSVPSFEPVAELYEKRRPSYPPELVGWVGEQLELGPAKTVVDVGAGTGKFTRLLVPTGANVIAVEPLEGMRAQLREAVDGVEVREGSAEELPLEDASADAVTAAAAFHWFELDRALPELHRVLCPGGRLAIVHNFRDLEDPLQAAVQEIIGHLLPDDSEFVQWESAIEGSGLFAPITRRRWTHEQQFDADGLAERIGTISYIARLPDREREEVLAAIRVLGEAQPETPFPFRYESEAFVCERLPGN